MTDRIDEILHKLEKRLANTLTKQNNGVLVGPKHYGDGFEEAKQAITALLDSKIAKANKQIPDKLLAMNISGVAMPRQETDKISIQDLRLALADTESNKEGVEVNE